MGHIHMVVLGEALVPFETRVGHAMQKIYRSREWASLQRSWLERLAKQLKHESEIDRQHVNIRFADTR
jgi:type I restriction enzyme R subunit